MAMSLEIIQNAILKTSLKRNTCSIQSQNQVFFFTFEKSSHQRLKPRQHMKNLSFLAQIYWQIPPLLLNFEGCPTALKWERKSRDMLLLKETAFSIDE